MAGFSRFFFPLLLGLLLSLSTARAQEETVPEPDTPAERAAAILEELDESRERREELEAGMADKQGESLRLQIRQLQAEELRGGNIVHELAKLVLATPDPAALGNARSILLETMETGPAGIQRVLEERAELLEERRQERDDAAPETELEAQDAVNTAARALDDVYHFYARHVRLMRKLGLNEAPAQASLVEQMEARADRLAALGQVLQEEEQVINEALAADVNDAAAKNRLQVLNSRRKSALTSLRLLVDLLQDLEVDTVEYQKALVVYTGDVSEIGLDAEVVTSLLEDWIRDGREWLRVNGWSLAIKGLVFLLTLFAAWLLARLIGLLVYKLLRNVRANMSRLLQAMLAGIAANIVLILGVLVALAQLGISVGPMLAGLGIAGFIVGFALQDTLSNFASGVMILIYRPFDEGDVIESAGRMGTVQAMNLVSTTILTFDNQTLIVPNNKIWGDVIRNVTHQKTRRVDLVVRVSHEADLDAAESLLKEVIAGEARVLADPPPNIRLHEVGEYSYDFIVRPWVAREDYWDVYWDLTRDLQRRLAAAGLKPPHPRREVRVDRGGDDGVSGGAIS